MIYAFKTPAHRSRLLRVLRARHVVYVVAVSWFFIPAEAWPVRALLVALGLVLSLVLPVIFADTLSPGPILTISAEGIRHLPFSRETAPWSAVREVTLTHGHSHARGSSAYYRFKLMGGVSSVVDNSRRFPVSPGGVQADNIAISIMPATVVASAEAIVAAIRRLLGRAARSEANAAPSDATLH